ncbi:MAG: tRNA (adenosine(37)-N6)-threonylcarbamoyltransferase complex dimerization subunit type 1 TsaB [Deltaproteobacteria bacterium]|nr:tRNA (adenosine(37)-N6)-threonylcarbamoyltransferase complex dimerization subunit type 1 TsaB [Deltaproteobacteria bacterium]
MRILSFDTSSRSGGIALIEDGRLTAECVVADVGAPSAWLLNGVDGFLKGLGRTLEEIDALAVGVGPGSFTGLRIGVSAAKGLGWALEKPVIGVSTLEALAMNAPYGNLRVCPVLDARKKEVYAAVFTSSGRGVERIAGDCVVSLQGLFELIDKTGSGPVVFLGNALGVYAELIEKNVNPAIIASEPLWHPRASNIGVIAFRDRGAAARPEDITPVYLRKSEAELKIQEGGRKAALLTLFKP